MQRRARFVPLSWLMRPETIRGLAEFGYLGEFGCFPLLTDPEDMATLIELRGKGHISKEARKRLKEFVEGRAREASTRLKRWLGLKRGRPRDFSKREVWAVAAALREKDPKKNSWRSLARQLDAKGFDDNRQRATDQMRHGVDAVLKDRRGKGKLA